MNTTPKQLTPHLLFNTLPSTRYTWLLTGTSTYPDYQEAPPTFFFRVKHQMRLIKRGENPDTFPLMCLAAINQSVHVSDETKTQY